LECLRRRIHALRHSQPHFPNASRYCVYLCREQVLLVPGTSIIEILCDQRSETDQYTGSMVPNMVLPGTYIGTMVLHGHKYLYIHDLEPAQATSTDVPHVPGSSWTLDAGSGPPSYPLSGPGSVSLRAACVAPLYTPAWGSCGCVPPYVSRVLSSQGVFETCDLYVPHPS
jgi:hypothetical protein